MRPPSSGARQFVRTSGVYFAGAALAKLVAFLMLPVYTRFLSPEDFGNFDFWSTLVSFAAPIAFFQVWDATYRFLLHDSLDHEKVVSNSYILMAGGLLLYTVLVLPLLHASKSAPILLTFAVGLTLCLQYFYGYFARAEGRNALFVATGIINTAVTAATGLVCLMAFHQDADCLYLALTLGNATQASMLAFALKPRRRFHLRHVDRAVQLALLRFSLPLCAASAAYWLLAGFTRVEIIYFDGSYHAGLYGVAMRFASVLTALTSIFLYAWNEFLYTDEDRFGGGSRPSRAAAMALEFSVTGAAATILVVRFSFDVLVDPRYASAKEIVPLVILATAFNGAASFMASLFMARLRTSWVLWTTLWAALVNVAVGIAATRVFGLVGAATTLAASFALLLAARAWLAHKLLRVRTVGPGFWIAVPLLVAALYTYYSKAPLWVPMGVLTVIGAAAVGSLVGQKRTASRPARHGE